MFKTFAWLWLKGPWFEWTGELGLDHAIQGWPAADGNWDGTSETRVGEARLAETGVGK